MAITNTYSAREYVKTVFDATGVGRPVQVHGPGFDVQVIGVTSGGGTMVLQRCYDAQITGASVFHNVKSYTADAEETGDHQANRAAWYRWSMTYVGGAPEGRIFV